jgi:hypothetical protein
MAMGNPALSVGESMSPSTGSALDSSSVAHAHHNHAHAHSLAAAHAIGVSPGPTTPAPRLTVAIGGNTPVSGMSANAGGPGGASSAGSAPGAPGSAGSGEDRQKPVCHSCRQVISTTQFIRVGNFSFHKEHFACFVCSKLLLDQRPRHRDGQFYCNEHFAERFCHTCRACGEKIVEGSVIRALGGYYHQHHFVCVECKEPFMEGKYYEADGQPYCARHYHQPEICVKCDRPIDDIDIVTLKGRNYHITCLHCHHCKVPLAGKGAVFQKDNHVYCRADYLNFFCKVCTACGEHIIKHVLSVNNEYYHPDCLKCAVCATRLTEYISVGGYLRCAEHTATELPAPSCSVCALPIHGDVTLSAGAKCHPACFRCSFCATPLDKAKTKLRDGRLCCTNCLAAGASAGAAAAGAAGGLGSPGVVSPDLGPRQLQAQAHSIGSPLPSGSGSQPDGYNYGVAVPPSVSRTASSSGPQPPQQHQQPYHQQAAASTGGYASSSGGADMTAATTAYGSTGSAGGGSVGSGSVGSSSAPASSQTAPSPAPGAAAAATSSAAPLPTVSGGVDSGSGRRPFQSVDVFSQANKACTIEWKRGEVIGKGSFGKVYLGMNTKSGEMIAVKQIQLNSAEDVEAAAQIQTEVTLMENLRHPNIVTLLGTQRSGQKLNILMEYVPFKSLDVLLEKFGALHEKVIQLYARQLVDALAYCHAHGVVHRDLKGKNVLADTNGNLKLADFGSAKQFQDVLRKDAPSLGYNYTPLWTAPEVLVGDYNSKVDIWSLGCVIIEMATGKPPWSEQNFEHPFRALYHIANENSIPKIPERLSTEGQDFLRLCLQRNPDERPSAADLLNHPWLAKNNNPE